MVVALKMLLFAAMFGVWMWVKDQDDT
jgi:hypothetical protein